MVDGVFAVAITLVPASLPNALPDAGGAPYVVTTLSIILIATTMLLLWYKIRNLVHLNNKLTPLEMVLLGVILSVVVMIPKSAFISIHFGGNEGNFWLWSDSQWVNFQYQLLFCWLTQQLFCCPSKRCAQAQPRPIRVTFAAGYLGLKPLASACLLPSSWLKISSSPLMACLYS
jgi:uncharacterized membrane protein